jgi:hypothetical protein
VLTDVVVLAVQAGSEEEPSKTVFYVFGSLLAAWAVIVAAVGIARHSEFPPSRAAANAVMALSALLVAATMASAVLTS